ncbi:hypothetical protein V6N11_083806 [Hibiscus sabdariffa]|uniref:Uncharacterized protein n=1 Tax=Hibiscus sabdariffa TaxID=183260 RepID=A0ABR2QD25_9ROSI
MSKIPVFTIANKLETSKDLASPSYVDEESSPIAYDLVIGPIVQQIKCKTPRYQSEILELEEDDDINAAIKEHSLVGKIWLMDGATSMRKRSSDETRIKQTMDLTKGLKLDGVNESTNLVSEKINLVVVNSSPKLAVVVIPD